MSKVVDNFLKYIAFDTQSAEDAASVPSTEKQFALAKLLVEQLKALGVKDVSMSEHCYVYGTIPATVETDCRWWASWPYGHLPGFFRREHPSPADPEL